MILDFNSASGQETEPTIDRVRKDSSFKVASIEAIKAVADCRELYRDLFPGFYREHGNCQCFHHEDGTASLQIDKDRAYCHAEKLHLDCIDLVKYARNIPTNEAIKELTEKYHLGNGKSKPTQKPKIIKTYDYTDENGNLVFQVVRFDPKDFRQRCPDGRGGWTWSVKGIVRVPYRLPDIIRADTVYIVEGEKDADRLRLLGLTATTCAGGAGKWLPEWSPYFKGRNVVIIPDNDDPGRKHADSIAHMLSNDCAASVKVVNLPGLAAKEDVSDWIEKGNIPEQLFKIVEQASDYQIPQSSCMGDAILEVSDFCSLNIPPKEMFLHPWLTEQQIFFINAWRGVGKSGFVLGILDALTKGMNFGPWECQTSPNCLYLDGEMACQDVIKRLQDLGDAPRKSKLYVYSDAYAHHLNLPRANLLDEEWREGIRQWMLQNDVKLWVIDNLASLTSGDENSKEVWDPIGKWLVSLRYDGISTGIIHHFGKDEQQRGTSAREDHSDIIIGLKRPGNYQADQGARFVVSFSKARIPIEHLSLMDETEFQAVKSCDVCEWSWKKVAADRRKQVLRSLDEGNNQAAVSTLIGVTRGYVSKIRNEAIKNGWMTEDNKLTQTGFNETGDY